MPRPSPASSTDFPSLSRAALCARLALLIGALAGAAALAWVSARASAAVARTPPYAEIHDAPQAVMTGTFLYNGRAIPVFQKTNVWGLLGEEPPRDWKRRTSIFAVGGSSTHGLVLDYGRDWPARLQARLKDRRPRTWVANLGIPGHSTRGHLKTLREFVLRLRPDAVVFMIGGNDLGLEFGAAWRPAEHPVPHDWTYWRLFLRSRLIQLRMDGCATLTRWLDPEAFPAGGVLSWAPSSLPPGALPDDADPRRLLGGLENYRANVRELARLARSRGIRPIFATQPYLFGDSPRWAGVFGRAGLRRDRRAVLSARLVARLLGAYNKVLLDACRAEKLDCIDLNAKIPHETRYFFDEIHPTPEGADLIARELARYLLTLDLRRAKKITPRSPRGRLAGKA